MMMHFNIQNHSMVYRHSKNYHLRLFCANFKRVELNVLQNGDEFTSCLAHHLLLRWLMDFLVELRPLFMQVSNHQELAYQ